MVALIVGVLDNIDLMSGYSYEALPPNFSVWENMLAGAFAGIAVNTPHSVELAISSQS